MGREARERIANKKARSAPPADPVTGSEPGHAEAGVSVANPPAPQLGDHWAVRPGGKGERENAKLIAQAIRWNTAANAKTFTEADPDKLSVKDIAVMVTRQGLIQGDTRAKAHHVGNVIRMEAQNQRDDLAYDPFTGMGATAGSDGDAPAVEVQQVRFYFPSNGRGPEPGLIKHDDSSPTVVDEAKPKRTGKRPSRRPPAG